MYEGVERVIESSEEVQKLIEQGVLTGESILSREDGSTVKAGELPADPLSEKAEINIAADTNSKAVTSTKPVSSYIVPGVLAGLGFVILMLQTVLVRVHDFSSQNRAYFVGYLFGALFVQIVIILSFWTIAWALTRKRKINGPLIFGIVYISLAFLSFASSIPANIRNERQYELVMQKVISMASAAASGSTISDDEVFKREIYGDGAEALEISRDLFKATRDIYLEMNEAVNKASLGTIMTKETLSDPDEIAASRSRLTALSNKLDEAERLLNDNMDKYILKVNETSLPRSYKEGLIQGFESGAQKYGIKEFYKIERNIVKAFDNILQFLQSNEGEYSFEEETLVFSRQEDVDEYNRLYSELEASIARETEWVDSLKEDFEDSIEKAQDELNK